MKLPRPKTGEEHDACSRWRHVIKSFSKSRKTKQIKRRMNRRFRRNWKPDEE